MTYRYVVHILKKSERENYKVKTSPTKGHATISYGSCTCKMQGISEQKRNCGILLFLKYPNKGRYKQAHKLPTSCKSY